MGLIIIEDACTCSSILRQYRPHEIALSAWLLALNMMASRTQTEDDSSDANSTSNSNSAIRRRSASDMSSHASKPMSSRWDTHVKNMLLTTLQRTAKSLSSESNGRINTKSNNSNSNSNCNSDTCYPQHSLLWHLCEKMSTSYSSIIQCSEILTDHMLYLKDNYLIKL